MPNTRSTKKNQSEPKGTNVDRDDTGSVGATGSDGTRSTSTTSIEVQPPSITQSQEADDMEVTVIETNNKKRMRNGSDTVSSDEEISKKKPPAKKKPETDVISTAVEVAMEAKGLVEELSYEYYSEENIGPIMAKVALALSKVTDALLKISNGDLKLATTVKRSKMANASTNTEAPAKKKAKNTGGKKLDARTPIYNSRGAETPKTDTVVIRSEGESNSESTSGTQTQDSTETEAPFEVKTYKKTFKKNIHTTQEQENNKKVIRKPAAVLIKVGVGQSYADTVRKVRDTEVDFESLGTKVTAMRKTMAGDLLVELTKSAQSTKAAVSIKDKLSQSLPNNTITCLRQNTLLEILDLDEITTKDEVQQALIKASGAENTNTDIRVISIWQTRNGRQQMATATVPTQLAGKISAIKVGWLQCRVRPRRPEPARCYRCHGFGHTTRQCNGPDLTNACRRCGQDGHKEKSCEAGHDRCVACERERHPKAEHKPGSGGCLAWRKALTALSKSKDD